MHVRHLAGALLGVMLVCLGGLQLRLATLPAIKPASSTTRSRLRARPRSSRTARNSCGPAPSFCRGAPASDGAASDTATAADPCLKPEVMVVSSNFDSDMSWLDLQPFCYEVFWKEKPEKPHNVPFNKAQEATSYLQVPTRTAPDALLRSLTSVCAAFIVHHRQLRRIAVAYGLPAPPPPWLAQP